MSKLPELIRCAERELAVRESAYPRWVAEKRVSQETADIEISAMRSIVSTLKWLSTNDAAIRAFIAQRKAALGKPEGTTP